MKVVKKQIELKDGTFGGPIIDLLTVRVENGKVYGYFELDESIKNTTVSIKFVKTGVDYPVGEFTGYEYFKTINIYENSMFSDTIFGWGGASDGEYHIYRNINYEPTIMLDEFIKGLGKVEEKSDPVPEGAELFIKKNPTASFSATCKIDPEVLKQLFM